MLENFINPQITIDHVTGYLDALKNIKRPECSYEDNENDSINDNTVYDFLSSEDKKKVDEAIEVVKAYESQNRLRAYLYRRGYSNTLEHDDDTGELYGSIEIPPKESDDDESSDDENEAWTLVFSKSNPNDND